MRVSCTAVLLTMLSRLVGKRLTLKSPARTGRCALPLTTAEAISHARVHRPVFVAAIDVAEPAGIRSVVRLRALELSYQRGVRRHTHDLAAVQAVSGIVLKEIPGAARDEAETAPIGQDADMILIPLLLHVFKHRKGGGKRIEGLHGGKSGAALCIAAVTQVHLEARLRKERKRVILQSAHGVHEMVAAGDDQAGIEVIVLAPEHVVAVEAVLLNAQIGGLIRIVAEPAGGKQDLVKPAAVALLRVDTQVGRQYADAVAVINIAAVSADAAAGETPAVADLDGVDDIVIGEIAAARDAHRFRRGRDRLLRLQGSEYSENQVAALQ